MTDCNHIYTCNRVHANINKMIGKKEERNRFQMHGIDILCMSVIALHSKLFLKYLIYFFRMDGVRIFT